MKTENPQALEHAKLAIALQDAGKLDEAIQSFRNALFLDPDFAPAYMGLGEIYQAQGELDEAVIYYEQALGFAPDNAEIHYNLGVILTAQNKTADAITHYERAIALQPNLTAAHNNLGNLFKSQGLFDAAAAHYQRVLALEPRSVQAYNNLGTLYHAEGKLDDAIACYERALYHAPNYTEAIHNLGDALVDRGDNDAAMAYYDHVLATNPNLHFAAYSKATVQLLQGDFAHGWEGYEARLKGITKPPPAREYPWPLWDGTKPTDGKVLIWGEQGIGDEIMFAGLIPDAMRRAGNAVVVDFANKRLLPLMQRSFPDIKIISGTDAGADIAAHISISSLPKLFRRSEAAFAETTSPYLVADTNMVEEFHARYQGGRRIGLSWHTLNKREGRWRSIPLATFAPLFQAAPNAQWINLQYGEPDKLAADIRAAKAPLVTDETVNQLLDMDRFAAQIAALDLVITIDNTTAHLVGALGVPTLLLVPHVPNWRWLLGRADSPWYPSLKLFRQSAPGDWAGVIAELFRFLHT